MYSPILAQLSAQNIINVSVILFDGLKLLLFINLLLIQAQIYT